jgi:hypothetical protein
VLVSPLTFAGDSSSSGPHLTQLQPRSAFPARASFATAYDPIGKKVVAFGGLDANGHIFNDTWLFDGRSWRKATTHVAPGARFAATMAYDGKIQKLVLFGGTAGMGRFNDTWLWDGATSTWQAAYPAHVPQPATNAMLFTEPVSGHAYMFGGSHHKFYSRDTFKWTGTDWKLLSPPDSPFPRAGGIAVADPVQKNVLVFGGVSDIWITQNTWTWRGGDWTEQSPAAQPDTLSFTTGAYDATRSEVIVFGGDSGGVDEDGTWAWDSANWTQLAPVTSPPARELFGTVWDSARHQLLIFGGLDISSGQFFGDTWLLTGG